MKPVWHLFAALALSGAACAAPVEINLVAINDFHGHLDATRPALVNPQHPGENQSEAGGAELLGAALQAWRREDPDLLFVAAGDLIGATPALSAMWADEPAIGVMNLLGLRVSAAGNHEFDQGRHELQRQLEGGCAGATRPAKTCRLSGEYRGAQFGYLAANVIERASGRPWLPAYRIETVKGVKLALIGAVTRETPSLVMGSGIQGLDFTDEAEAINRLLPELRAQGVQAFVVLIHEGGGTRETYNQADCGKLEGPIVPIVKRLDPAIKLVISGHTHRAYLCNVDGRVVTQAAKGGQMLSRIRLTLDDSDGQVRAVQASNVLLQPGQYAPDPRITAYLAQVRTASAAALAQPVARVAVNRIERVPSAAGESRLGSLVADALLDATRAQGVQLALMNLGGIREPLQARQQVVSMGDALAVLPYGNVLVLMDLSGAQLREILEQQWEPKYDERRLLQVSRGLHYVWDKTRPAGQRILPGSLTLDGQPLGDGQRVRIVTNNFLAEGGSNFDTFRAGQQRVETPLLDIDAFVHYLSKLDKEGRPAGQAETQPRIELFSQKG
ncbi:bifunctional UDP-sugar hydrolase/5'-nucleotidase [Massilia sp. TS11]|uniref:bifunctional metallophosphatase/5'-nucleotidase n=1 Tax=Massilia sp. TS11 TaxID=2908003 RepID=UPI001EDC428A|nr:bifunctional metallophosphatase/5'-nucleotidase [Massilia sp. TS11]MCG2586095.1 bifunctional metallophosphatase/5'-nucleotidase [Massilia sp. TS11]